MDISVDQKCDIPISKQIFSQVIQQIMAGALVANDSLPSVRSLANELQISCETVRRAYDLLKMKGYVYAIPGKGYYVVSNLPGGLTLEDFACIEKLLSQIEEVIASYHLGLKDVLVWSLQK